MQLIKMSTGQDSYFVWDYSEKSDILNIHRKGKRVEGSAELEDFTVDFDKNDNVVGIEVAYASEFLSELGIEKDQLSTIKGAEIITQRRANYVLAWIKLITVVRKENGEEIRESRIPIPAPVTVSR